MKLFIDDERFPPEDSEEWAVRRSYEDAIEYLENNEYHFISFDHDLGDDSLSGYDIVSWMIERDLDCDGSFIPADFTFYVHSQNPVGAANIRQKLDNYLKFRNS